MEKGGLSMDNTHGAVIVSWDFSHGRDKDILLVGRKTPKADVEVINAFQGKEARDIYEKLVAPNG
jgi:hypothetical protein